MTPLLDGESRHGAPRLKLLMETLAREVSEDLRRRVVCVLAGHGRKHPRRAKKTSKVRKAASVRKITPTLQQGGAYSANYCLPEKPSQTIIGGICASPVEELA